MLVEDLALLFEGELLCLWLLWSVLLLHLLSVLLLVGDDCSSWVLADGSVSILVDLLKVVSCDSGLDVAGELLVVLLFGLLLELAHVVSDGATEDVVLVALDNLVSWDVLAVLASILVLLVELAGEAADVVWDEEATIDGTLHDGEDLSACCCTSKTNIEDDLEWASVLFIVEVFLCDLCLEDIGKLHLCEEAASNKKTCSISSWVVGKTELDAVLWKFCGESLADCLITCEFGNNDLSDNLCVCEK